MPVNNDHIADLIIKHLQEKITAGEAQNLEQWIAASDDNRAKFSRLTNGETLSEDLMAHGLSDQQIKELVYGQLPEVQDALTVIDEPKRNWMRYASVAAAVLVIAFASIWLLRSKETAITKVTEQQISVATDIPPGGDKATLTLADGSVVVLDSFSKGRLVQQGQTTVSNKGGQLVYEGTGKSDKVLYNTLITSKGETFGMILSDGSKVWLNSQSSIRYPVEFAGDLRKVEITGEAYFEVATVPSISTNGQKGKQPFIVSLNGMELEVLGTKFNVNSYADENEVKTSLVEGRVRVRSKKNEEIILHPEQQAILSKQTQKLNRIDNVDVEEALAWHFGYFQFNGAGLQAVLKQLARWYDVEIVYQGDIPQRQFWGKISRSNSLSQVLHTLEINDVSFKIEGKKIVVLP